MLLNFLKVLGLTLSSLSAVIATLKETKTPDKKHLTAAGKALLALGVLGFSDRAWRPIAAMESFASRRAGEPGAHRAVAHRYRVPTIAKPECKLRMRPGVRRA